MCTFAPTKHRTQIQRRMKNTHSSLVILKSTLGRLPSYYCYIEDRVAAGDEYVSSAQIAASLSINPVQVRKDLASISSAPGRPKLGFKAAQLFSDIKAYLGYDHYDEAVLVGVGALGHVLLNYGGFANYGLQIVAGFDVKPREKTVGGKMVMPMTKIEAYLGRMHTKIGIIAVPAREAQKVADLLVKNGVEAIWNFAPTTLSVPENILVKNENLAASFAVLAVEHNRRR